MCSNAYRVDPLSRVAPKKAVYVLKIGSRSLAVGVTDNHITTLAELDTEETNLAYPTSLPSNGTPSFANLLKDVRTRIAGGQA
jgi:flagellar biogenesis protein FliO